MSQAETNTPFTRQETVHACVHATFKNHYIYTVYTCIYIKLHEE